MGLSIEISSYAYIPVSLWVCCGGRCMKTIITGLIAIAIIGTMYALIYIHMEKGFEAINREAQIEAQLR